ncbi:hypothetical protein KR038_004190, partial [Drosophila bunnanda]
MSPEAQQAVEALKVALTTAPVLVHADFQRHFYIQCDASHVGVGAVLFQKNEEDQEQPIAFFSAKMNRHQVNYTVTEKECLASLLAIYKFRPYVEGMPFTCITDHASLKWLMSMKDLSGRLAKWSLQLQGFNFRIEHRKGSENVVADTLSRCVDEIAVDPTKLLGFETTEFAGDEYKELVREILENKDNLPDLRIEDGLIFKRTSLATVDDKVDGSTWKLWIPQSHSLVERAHSDPNAAHGGMGKTLEILRR